MLVVTIVWQAVAASNIEIQERWAAAPACRSYTGKVVTRYVTWTYDEDAIELAGRVCPLNYTVHRSPYLLLHYMLPKCRYLDCSVVCLQDK